MVSMILDLTTKGVKMSTSIFVNLPVKDLMKSMAFFTSLGFKINQQFTNENGASLVISDNIYYMLLTETFFKTFITKKIADAHEYTEVINALGVDSRVEVDTLVDKAFAAGAKKYRDPQDDGWMYSRSFEDLDGHLWEVAYMDLSQLPQ
jgi:uncharacterized protein